MGGGLTLRPGRGHTRRLRFRGRHDLIVLLLGNLLLAHQEFVAIEIGLGFGVVRLRLLE